MSLLKTSFPPLLILAVTIPARVALMDQSLWLDEAWVANSLIADSWTEMFSGATWIQSSPPLFLLLSRLIAAVAGPSEWALRIWPWIASAAAVPVFYLALRAFFGRSPALLGTTLLATNYWSIKLAQQVKQYTGDLLVSSLFVWAIAALAAKRPVRPALLIALAAAGPWLSAPSLFLLPALALAIALRNRSGDERRPVAPAGAFVALAVLSVALNYALVLRPAMAETLRESWRPYMLAADFHSGLFGFAQNVARLLAPPASGWIGVVSWTIAGCALLGAVRQLRGRATRGGFVLIAGALPILACVGASALGWYPTLAYPRMILWMLPSLAILAVSGVEPIVSWFERRSPARWPLPAMCLAAALAAQVIFLRFPRPAEHNRPAVVTLAGGVRAGDVVYVHGGVAEAFAYYTRLLRWTPPEVYLGNSGWPCCPRDRTARVTNAKLNRLEDELIAAAAAARGHRLWVYSPSGATGHWAASLKPVLEKAPDHLSAAGCVETIRRSFDQSQLLAFDCRPTPVQTATAGARPDR